MPREGTTYRGTVTLISGITQNSKKDKYPLVHADDVQVGNDESYRLTDYVDSHDNIINGSGDNSLQHMPLEEENNFWDNSETTNPYLLGKKLNLIESETSEGEEVVYIKADDNNNVEIGAFGSNSTMWNAKSQATGGKSHAEGSKTIALSNNAHAEGNDTFAGGKHSHAEGNSTAAVGNSAHSEGNKSQALGVATHAEGAMTIAKIQNSHAEGANTLTEAKAYRVDGIADISIDGGQTILSNSIRFIDGTTLISDKVEAGMYLSVFGFDSEGESAKDRGTISEVINETTLLIDITNNDGKGLFKNGVLKAGCQVLIDGGKYGDEIFDQTKAGATLSSHAEGTRTIARLANHAEGIDTEANGFGSHAEGRYSISKGEYSHAEGYNTLAGGHVSHAEGTETEASGSNSHSEGGGTTASGYCSHAEGANTTASGDYSHTEGRSTRASGNWSHAEGSNTIASNDYSHAEGNNTKASGSNSHAEGYKANASGLRSHAEGDETTASGSNSHAEGRLTQASNDQSHAEGLRTVASGKRSHAEGLNTIAIGNDQHVQGKYNLSDANKAHIVGGGTSDADRKNIHTIDWDGNAEFSGVIKSNGFNSSSDIKLKGALYGGEGITTRIEKIGEMANANAPWPDERWFALDKEISIYFKLSEDNNILYQNSKNVTCKILSYVDSNQSVTVNVPKNKVIDRTEDAKNALEAYDGSYYYEFSINGNEYPKLQDFGILERNYAIGEIYAEISEGNNKYSIDSEGNSCFTTITSNYIILNSSTPDSTKQFKLSINDDGELSVSEL